jgi:DNA gyrase inhibitor GyrI
MDNTQVKIINLEPMHMISFSGFGESPEGQALAKLNAWAQAHDQHGRVFGFNNPNPSAGSPNYGYEVWMCVEDGIQPDGDGRMIDFTGGKYAVLRCPVVMPENNIPGAWQALVKWLDASEYSQAGHQWLEEHIDLENAAAGGNFTLDLYLPIR